MRPVANESDGELYECYRCGRRTDSVDGLTCDGCGGPVRNIGRERDL